MVELRLFCDRCGRSWTENAFSGEHISQGRRCPWPKRGAVLKASAPPSETCGGGLSIGVNP